MKGSRKVATVPYLFILGVLLLVISAVFEPSPDSSDEWLGAALLWVGVAFLLISLLLISLPLVFVPSRRLSVTQLAASGTGLYAILVILTLAISGALCGIFWSDLQGPNEPPLSTTIRNVMLIVGGVLALPLAMWRGYVAEQQVKATQDKC